uniref:FLYWCH-type domain-containing protein n=1 Tax=Panagrolaimus sp. ES5 TaxID=591445 RepID=A0AC34G1J1_9BILA
MATTAAAAEQKFYYLKQEKDRLHPDLYVYGHKHYHHGTVKGQHIWSCHITGDKRCPGRAVTTSDALDAELVAEPVGHKCGYNATKAAFLKAATKKEGKKSASLKTESEDTNPRNVKDGKPYDFGGGE